MTNTIRLKITCFLLLFTVLLIKDILDLAWHLATRMKFGTCEQNWDLFGTISGLLYQWGPNEVPNLGPHYEHCMIWWMDNTVQHNLCYIDDNQKKSL